MVAQKSIAEEMRIFKRYNDYRYIPAAVKAWITIKAKQRGLNPVMVHAGIKARYSRIANARSWG